MAKNRKAFVVYLDLDDLPGVMHTPESALAVVRNLLSTTIPHYNPVVTLAPKDFQPECEEVQ